MAYKSGPLQQHTVTIASGQSLSAGTDLGQGTLCGVWVPANWTTAGITFQGSPDGVSWGELCDETTNISLPSMAASTYVALMPVRYYGVRFLKVRSGTSGTPVNQSNPVTITLIKQAIP